MTDSKEAPFSVLAGKHILVTGGAGYIGSHVVLELLNVECTVTVVDNFSNSCFESLARVQRLTGKTVHFHEVDMCSFDALAAVFAQYDETPFDAVIHFAGLKAVGESASKPLLYYSNNLTSTLHLLQLMEKHSVDNFVFSSSATVYGGVKEMPIVETAPLSCTNPYGYTKLFIEQILRDQAAARPSLRVALLRYFNPVGAHASGQIGEDPKGIPNNLCPYILQVAIGRRPHLSVFGNDYDTPDGTGVRDYIHVVDLARGHLAALASGVYGTMGSNCEAFNLGTGRGYSVLEMVKAVEQASGRTIEYKIAPRRPGDVATVYANCDKARRVLGWSAELSLEDAMRDSWLWQSTNPTGFITDPAAL